MKEEYRFLGEYIRQVDIRNKEGKKENLLGVSVQKQFIQSIANTVGTDFTKYKVVKKGQFTYIPDTSRRGDKIAIALLEDYEEGLVSNVYTVFEVIDTEKLLPEYLMLWFSRPEFDRYARFKSHGSVREVMDWEEMCKVELPVPDIEKQRKIVKAYKTITDRIALKQKINDNLVACIDTIFNEQFGNFKALAESSTANTDFSSLPDGWTIENAVHSFDISIGKTPPRSEPEWFTSNQTDNVWISIADMKTNSPFIFKSAEYLTNEAVKKHNVKIVPANSVLLSFKMTVGRVAIVTNEVTTNEAIAHFPCTKENLFFVYCYLKNFNYGYLGSTSSITTAINSKIIKEMPFLMPSKKELDLFNHKVSGLFEQLKYISKELDILEELSKMLLPQLLGHC
ncbi:MULTISPECIES: restriction endonuclease subunit S [Dorea]|uniref:restriction endonuclease subunit S n=1 Tax=Dorea TaxID=189330 RepID=UPI001FAD93F1|nr:restriction endonuclease subunit S [Dorea longicatena]